MFFLVIICLLGCNDSQENSKGTAAQQELKAAAPLPVDTPTVPAATVTDAVVADTTIVYDIEGVSAEGAEASVTYSAKKIRRAEIKLYGETGQARITYLFQNGKILVTEKTYRYKEGLENVESAADMKLEKNISYTIDMEGKLIGKADPERIDMFKEFREAVPFDLK